MPLSSCMPETGRAMRILVAHAFYRQAGGEDRYVMRQVDLLRRRHEVRLLAEHNDELAQDGRTAVKMVYSRTMKQRAERVIATSAQTSCTCTILSGVGACRAFGC